MAGYGAKEARIKGDRVPRVTTCGDCGVEIDHSQILCVSCQRLEDEATGKGLQLVREFTD